MSATSTQTRAKPSIGPMVSLGRRIRRTRLGRVVVFVLLFLISALWVVPLLWALDTSLKPEGETTAVPPSWFPTHWTVDAYFKVLGEGNLPRWLLNSFVTTVTITVVTVILASLVAFALSRMPFRGRTAVFWLILAGIMIPSEALIVPLFYEINSMNLINTYGGITLPQLTSPIAVFIFKQFFDGIPKDFEEAASLDGASMLRIYWQIWMPLSRPAIATVAILAFIGAWNNFLWPLIVVTSTNMMTVPVGLVTIQGSFGLRYAQIMASAILAAVPMLVVFALFQRQIIEGMSGGVK